MIGSRVPAAGQPAISRSSATMRAKQPAISTCCNKPACILKLKACDDSQTTCGFPAKEVGEGARAVCAPCRAAGAIVEDSEGTYGSFDNFQHNITCMIAWRPSGLNTIIRTKMEECFVIKFIYQQESYTVARHALIQPTTVSSASR